MAKVEFTDHALHDIDEIATYIAVDSELYAKLQVAKIVSRVDQLATHPLSGRIVPEFNIRSIRELIEGNYRIIYRVVNREVIHILTVHHSRRHLRRSILKRK